jgi:hypothetical protein
MPRKRKTLSGDDAQQIESVPGQRYGEGVAQQQMQQAMPAPQKEFVATPSRIPAERPQAQVNVPQTSMSVQDLLANIPRGTLRQQGVAGNTLTNGISIGPGTGPAPIGMSQQMSNYQRVLSNLAQRTDNPMIRSMLESL